MRAFLTLALLCGLVPTATALAGEVADICFEPGGNCEQVIVREIMAARSQILVQAFSFTSRPIASALVAAHQRGVDVRLIVDADQYAQHMAETQWCAKNGIPVGVDAPPGRFAHAHDKIEIIDGARVITGSYNPTAHAGEVNVENLVVLAGRDVAGRYVQHFLDRNRLSRALVP